MQNNNNRGYRNITPVRRRAKKKKNFVLIPAIFSLVVIFAVVLIILFINRDEVYNALNGGENNSESISENQNQNQNQGQNAVSPNDNQSPSDLQSAQANQANQTNQTEQTTPEETTAEDISQAGYIDVPKSDFMQSMFDSAVTIPGTSKKIEPPPDGRSLDLQASVVPLSDKIPEPYEYFKNIILLGDSVTSGFDIYKKSIKFNDENVTEDLTVVASTSYGVYNASRDVTATTVHPVFDGKQMKSEDIIAKLNAKYVFICLGLNDLTWAKVDKYIETYDALIKNIQAKNPDKKIVIMSVTPVIAGEVRGDLSNNVIIEANNALIEFARGRGIPFIDYAAAIRESGNSLYKDLSSDGYCHIKVEAYDRIVEYLLHHPIS